MSWHRSPIALNALLTCGLRTTDDRADQAIDRPRTHATARKTHHILGQMTRFKSQLELAASQPSRELVAPAFFGSGCWREV